MSPRARVALVIALLGFALLAARLGVWQLHRLAQRRAANAAALSRRREPEVDVTQRDDQPLANRRVTARGSYDRTHELVLRGQVFHEVPGVVLVTPLKLAERADTAVLVDRGFVPTPDAVTLPADAARLNEPGVQEIRGIALPILTGADAGATLSHSGNTTWGRLDLAALRARLPYPILDVVIRQTPDSTLPKLPRRREPPALDEGPHLSYAIQWFSFALIAVVFAGIFGVRRSR